MASFNDLPDELIRYIFNRSPWMDILINSMSVCKRWHNIIREKLNETKYLVYRPNRVEVYDQDKKSKLFASGLVFDRDVVLYEGSERDPKNLIISVKNLPNLNILELGEDIETIQRLIHLIFTSTDNVIGVWYHNHMSPIPRDFKITTTLIEYGDANVFQQLYIGFVIPEIWPILARLYKMRRLHIDFFHAPALKDYKGPNFNSIEILEVAGMEHEGLVNLVDKSPNLKSMVIHFVGCADFRDTGSKLHHSLENLVLEYSDESYQTWAMLFPFLQKFPNLKTLAIRNNFSFHNQLIREILQHFKNLRLLDVRGCRITDECLTYLDSYYTKFPDNRLREFIWGEIEHQFYSTKFTEPVVEGIDFMEMIFHTSFSNLPILLKPAEFEHKAITKKN